MDYMEYPAAEIFYSICVPQNPSLDYAELPLQIFLPCNSIKGCIFYG